MAGRLIVVTGTGTEIGKTHVSEALLLALHAISGGRVVGVKPVETGLATGGITDAARLEQASSFHVKHSAYIFDEPVSPHIAARTAGRPIDLREVTARIEDVRAQVDTLLVELAGGLFSPLAEDTVNADLASALRADALLLVAPDRLGALHDVTAAVRAARHIPLRIDGAALVCPAQGDGSTTRNARELEILSVVPWAVSVPRAPPSALAEHPSIRALAERLGQPRPTTLSRDS